MEKKIVFLFISLLLIHFSFAQALNGIHFQGVARNENGMIIPNKQINIKISIIMDSVFGEIVYQEIKSITTNMLGLFFVVIGNEESGKVITIGRFDQIKWKAKTHYIQVALDPNNNLSFINAGIEKINYVPLAIFAETASRVENIVPIEYGGTGVGNVKELLKLLNIDKVNNTPDSLKPVSIPFTSFLNEKLLLKLNALDTIKLSNRINLKLNYNDTISLSNRINNIPKLDTISLSNRIIAIPKIDTTSLSNRINNKISLGALNTNEVINAIGFMPVKNIYGVFYDTTKQITTVSTATAIKFNFQQFSNKINIANNSSGNPTRIMVNDMGIYQINFTIQFLKLDAGNDELSIWIRRNSIAYPNTNINYVIQGGGVKNIYVGNYIIDLGTNDYIELFYSIKNTSSTLYGTYSTSTTPSRPATPSVYLSMHAFN
jgi:hypothetical protein